MRTIKVERIILTTGNGTRHERLSVFNDRSLGEIVALSFERSELDVVEELARELLRLAAEWRSEVLERSDKGAINKKKML